MWFVRRWKSVQLDKGTAGLECSHLPHPTFLTPLSEATSKARQAQHMTGSGWRAQNNAFFPKDVDILIPRSREYVEGRTEFLGATYRC